ALKEIVRDRKLTFEITGDPAQMASIDLAAGRVLIGLDFVERLWAYSYAYLQVILLVQSHGWSGVSAEIPPLASSMLAAAFETERDGKRLTWRRGWPRPHPSEESQTDGFAATELFLLTAASVLLHEIGHAARGHKASDLAGRWKAQEFEADDWAI